MAFDTAGVYYVSPIVFLYYYVTYLLCKCSVSAANSHNNLGCNRTRLRNFHLTTLTLIYAREKTR